MDCIGCVGLRHKTNHIFNQPYSKENYAKFLEQYPLSKEASVFYILGKQEELRKKMPAQATFGSHNSRVSGDHIYNARNVQASFDIKGGENSRYSYTSGNLVESFDISFSPNTEYCYQCLTSMKSHGAKFCHLVNDSQGASYSEFCFNCKNIFGCIGLRNKSLCILNKQYTKAEYEKLLPQIIENMKNTRDWGNFFPIWMSPFGYNESIANEYMPLEKSDALAQGFTWRDDIPSTKGQENCNYKDLPENPNEYSDENLLNKILKCSSCDKNYRFISREIAFYKRMKLALPAKCFNCRHQARMNNRNPRVLTEVTCVSCGKKTFTTYPKAKHKLYRIHCEDCYKQVAN
jgi:hypothetical protein